MKNISNTVFWIVVIVFFSAALFFTVKVETFKRSLNRSSDIVLQSGQKVTVVKIIDGDEISVKLLDSQFIVRILGIMSYTSSVNDPVIENAAKDAFNYLSKNVLNHDVELVFEKFQKDSSNRILSNVYKNGADVGLEMIKNGYSIVYTRYPFPKMEEYLKEEITALRNKKGLWEIPTAKERSLQLKRLWKNELDAGRK